MDIGTSIRLLSWIRTHDNQKGAMVKAGKVGLTDITVNIRTGERKEEIIWVDFDKKSVREFLGY